MVETWLLVGSEGFVGGSLLDKVRAAAGGRFLVGEMIFSGLTQFGESLLFSCFMGEGRFDLVDFFYMVQNSFFFE